MFLIIRTHTFSIGVTIRYLLIGVSLCLLACLQIADAVSNFYQICENMVRIHCSSIACVVAGVFAVFPFMLSIMMDWIGSGALLLKLSSNRLPPCFEFISLPDL